MSLSDTDATSQRCVDARLHDLHIVEWRPPHDGTNSVDPATVSLHRRVCSCRLGLFYGTFIAFRHSCTLPVMAHAVEVRPYARGKLCCLTRHHFRACPTPAAVVTSKLIHSAFACGLFALERAKTARVSDPTPHLLSQHAITSTPGPRQVYVPITSLSALAFAHTVRAPRVSRHRRLYP